VFAQSEFPSIKLTRTFGGVRRPTAIAHASDGTGRLFIAEQEGTIRVVKDGVVQPAPFLNIRDRVTKIEPDCCDERGLLGVAFPPGYATKQRLYVFYTDLSNTITVSRFAVSSDPEVADADSEKVILKLEHPYENHFGGQLAFSPLDGHLYAGFGDGAGGGDPYQSGQDLNQLYAKIIRIDVENGSTTPEIVAMGLRNPWRFSFDRDTGDLFVGDVGDSDVEEVNLRPAGTTGISNFGWSILEGDRCMYRTDTCTRDGLIPPVAQYDHQNGCAVVGGYVYRGASFPRLSGSYFYADFCFGSLWAMTRKGERWESRRVLEGSELNISAFGEDESGELYAADYLTGDIYLLAEDKSTEGSGGEREIKRGAPSRNRLHPNPPTVTLDNFFADRQADSDARNLAPVQPLEDSEDSLGVLRGDSDAVVCD
jgi:glucose/arabinose dehydrogenase